MRGEWTMARDILLQQMWESGVGTTAIGVSLGCSKNAIIGRARRLGLDRRPSPIKRLGPGESPKRRRSRAKAAVLKPARVVPPKPSPAPLPPVAYVPLEARRRGCLWPMWNHRERATHLYCGEPVSPGCAYPWCAAHRAKGTERKETV